MNIALREVNRSIKYGAPLAGIFLDTLWHDLCKSTDA